MSATGSDAEKEMLIPHLMRHRKRPPRPRTTCIYVWKTVAHFNEWRTGDRKSIDSITVKDVKDKNGSFAQSGGDTSDPNGYLVVFATQSSDDTPPTPFYGATVTAVRRTPNPSRKAAAITAVPRTATE
jgi:hypothetical protein